MPGCGLRTSGFDGCGRRWAGLALRFEPQRPPCHHLLARAAVAQRVRGGDEWTAGQRRSACQRHQVAGEADDLDAGTLAPYVALTACRRARRLLRPDLRDRCGGSRRLHTTKSGLRPGVVERLTRRRQGLVAAAATTSAGASAGVDDEQNDRNDDRDQNGGDYQPPCSTPRPQSAPLCLLLTKCGHKTTSLFLLSDRRSPLQGSRKPAVSSRSHRALRGLGEAGLAKDLGRNRQPVAPAVANEESLSLELPERRCHCFPGRADRLAQKLVGER